MITDREIARILLCSLPASYDNLIIALETHTDALTADFVRIHLLQDEAWRNDTKSTGQEESTFSTKGGRKNRGNQSNDHQGNKSNDRGHTKKKPKCFYCDKIGHKITDCYKKQAEERLQAKQTSDKSQREAAFVTAVTSGMDDTNKWYIDSSII